MQSWQNFYVLVGGAAGALTGLQFVVMALIADMPTIQTDEIKAANAFATPTIFHFVAVLLMSALMVIPWDRGPAIVYIWAIAGLAGLAYSIHVTFRMIRQTSYKPVFEDWLFHAILPVASYAAIATAAALALFFAFFRWVEAPLLVAFALLTLLTLAIHNAWDNVTYLVILRRERLDAKP